MAALFSKEPATHYKPQRTVASGDYISKRPMKHKQGKKPAYNCTCSGFDKCQWCVDYPRKPVQQEVPVPKLIRRYKDRVKDFGKPLEEEYGGQPPQGNKLRKKLGWHDLYCFICGKKYGKSIHYGGKKKLKKCEVCQDGLHVCLECFS